MTVVLHREVPAADLRAELRSYLKDRRRRLGLISSLNGAQVVTVVLDTTAGQVELWESPLEEPAYPAVSPVVPQAHWFERGLLDLFDILPEGHPRMKSIYVKESFDLGRAPLRSTGAFDSFQHEIRRDFHFMQVSGEGVYELPVGPVHAGIIEPGHFRLSCLGEIIENLELRFGYLHRGVEKRLAAVPWQKGRFVAEAAASDTAAAGALAHAIAIETVSGIAVPARARHVRTLALEIERIAMHVADIGGMAVDIGFLGVAAALSRLRGTALRAAELLSGSRFLRGFIIPGGIVRDPAGRIGEAGKVLSELYGELEPVLHMFVDNAAVHERLSGIGIVPRSLAEDFGLVGVAARASGIAYDARRHFSHGLYPQLAPDAAVEDAGDVLSRIKVRCRELETSFALARRLCEEQPDGPISVGLPDRLPANRAGAGVVEAFRGELLHVVVTDGDGSVKRYMIKDPSHNNWTAMAIAARNNLIADFPLCNKSFSLSYSGHDL